MKSEVTLYLNAAEDKVVAEGDPAAAFLLIRAGSTKPDGEISRLGDGILKQAQALAGKPAKGKAVEAPAENKAVEAPAENKGAKVKG